jgi:hypothetical protein
MYILKAPPFDLSKFDDENRKNIQELHRASLSIVIEALENIPIKTPGLEYHNRRHSEDVVYGFLELGKKAVDYNRISIYNFYIGLIAAASHDLYYDKDLAGTGENEAKSTKETLKLMQKHKVFTRADMEKVAKVHKATVFKRAGKEGIVQSAEKGNYLEELITDIDTGGIGMKWPNAKERIYDYYREIKEKEPDETDPDYLKFLHFQVDVLSGHSYKTCEAQSKYSYLSKNVEQIKKIIDKIS